MEPSSAQRGVQVSTAPEHSASEEQDLESIRTRTLGHYEREAHAFWEGTKEHDVSQNRSALLNALEGPGPHRILDLGCGPGRDLVAFRDLGHLPIGLDGCEAFVEMAKAHAGCEVWRQDFHSLDLPRDFFDGVFANASLFHVPLTLLPRVLSQLYETLRVGGVLFSSNPRGGNRAGFSGERYGVFHEWEHWSRHVTRASFVEVNHYYRPPDVPRAEQTWLASVWRKPGLSP